MTTSSASTPLPENLNRERPLLYSNVFPVDDEQPTYCKFDLAVLAAIDSTMTCRHSFSQAAFPARGAMLGMPFSTTPYAMQPDCLRATGGTQPGAGAWLAGASFGAQPGAGAWLAGTPDGALPIQSLMHSERSPPKSLGEMLVPTSPQTSTLARCTSIDFDSQGSEMQTTPGALPSALALQHSSEGTFAAGKQEISHATVALASPSEPLQALARCTSIDFDSQGSQTQPTPIALPSALALQHS